MMVNDPNKAYNMPYTVDSSTVLYVLGKAYPVEFTSYLKEKMMNIAGVRDCAGVIAYNRAQGINKVMTINVTYQTHRLDNEKLFMKIGELINTEKIKYELNFPDDWQP